MGNDELKVEARRAFDASLGDSMRDRAVEFLLRIPQSSWGQAMGIIAWQFDEFGDACENELEELFSEDEDDCEVCGPNNEVSKNGE